MIGPRYGKVEIVDHRSSWAEEFDKEKEFLYKALGDEVVGIEHVGSTAVDGLAAKATLDILVGVKELHSPEFYLSRLQTIGYTFRPDHPVPGRLHFAKISQGMRTHNLSLTQYGSQFWEDHILFRDYLRKHPEECITYQDLKLQLAEKYSDDTVRYTDGKNEYVEQVLEKAKKTR